jgi:hypothetical protein
MTAKEMKDDNFINFQDDFYNLLEKYGVSSISIEHPQFETICNLRNSVVEFIEQELYSQALESGEIKTDDPDEFEAWLERNEEDYRETDGTTAEEV